jgi:hypothetical protein
MRVPNSTNPHTSLLLQQMFCTHFEQIKHKIVSPLHNYKLKIIPCVAHRARTLRGLLFWFPVSCTKSSWRTNTFWMAEWNLLDWQSRFRPGEAKQIFLKVSTHIPAVQTRICTEGFQTVHKWMSSKQYLLVQRWAVILILLGYLTLYRYMWLLAICFNSKDFCFIHKMHLWVSCDSQNNDYFPNHYWPVLLCVEIQCVFYEVRTAFMNII